MLICYTRGGYYLMPPLNFAFLTNCHYHFLGILHNKRTEGIHLVLVFFNTYYLRMIIVSQGDWNFIIYNYSDIE